jgi:peptidoglycan-associated lipoprotein
VRSTRVSARIGAGAAAFAALVAGACTCPTGDFGVTKPADDEHLPPGDVIVCVTAVSGSFCYFAPKGYEVTLDGATNQTIPPGASPLCTTFRSVTPGLHVAEGWALDNGKRGERTARVRFTVDAPPAAALAATAAEQPPPDAPQAPPPPAPPPPSASVVAAPVEESVAITQKGGYLEDIFFDFDRSAVKVEYRDRLARGAEWLKSHPEMRVTIEGHCDVRGAAKLNLILGEKRARVVRDALVTLGVDGGRLSVTTVGEERPFDAGRNEDAYAKNRRAHFIITKN